MHEHRQLTVGIGRQGGDFAPVISAFATVLRDVYHESRDLWDSIWRRKHMQFSLHRFGDSRLVQSRHVEAAALGPTAGPRAPCSEGRETT